MVIPPIAISGIPDGSLGDCHPWQSGGIGGSWQSEGLLGMAIRGIGYRVDRGNYWGQVRGEIMDRGMELRIKGHLYEITALNDEACEKGRQGFHSSEEGYTRTFESVAECAGAAMVDKVAKHIKDEMRRTAERPDNQSVRRKARMMLSEEDYVTDTYLNRA